MIMNIIMILVNEAAHIMSLFFPQKKDRLEWLVNIEDGKGNTFCAGKIFFCAGKVFIKIVSNIFKCSWLRQKLYHL